MVHAGRTSCVTIIALLTVIAVIQSVDHLDYHVQRALVLVCNDIDVVTTRYTDAYCLVFSPFRHDNGC